MLNGKPLMIDGFCGLGGASAGFLAEGWECVGFDNERHDYGNGGYPGQLVLQDILTIRGSQFKDADFLWFSPPCQEFSYMAMPWSRAKQIRREYLDGTRDRADLTRLFDACFRIQREACEAAGRHIPMIVENVRGAQEWVGHSAWHYGSFHLWGDVPALMPNTARTFKNRSGGSWFSIDGSGNRVESNCGRDKLAAELRHGLKLPGNNSQRRWEDREVARLGGCGEATGHLRPTRQRQGRSLVSGRCRTLRQQVQRPQAGVRRDRENTARLVNLASAGV